MKDLNLFDQKLTLYKYHTNKDTIISNVEQQTTTAVEDLHSKNTGENDLIKLPQKPLKPKSKATPHISQYKLIDTFVEFISKYLQKLKRRKKHLSNLNADESKGLKK